MSGWDSLDSAVLFFGIGAIVFAVLASGHTVAAAITEAAACVEASP